jgi:hypothetical protein
MLLLHSYFRAGIAGKGSASFLQWNQGSGQRLRIVPLPRIFFIPCSGKGFLWKPRWLLWLEGIGHRTCLAVQQQRFGQNDKQC